MNLFLIFLTSFSLGCSSITSEGALVQLIWDQNDVKGCDFKGNIDSYSGWGGVLAQSAGEEDAKNKLRNEAAGLGANRIVLNNASGGFFGGRASGRAYFCH